MPVEKYVADKFKKIKQSEMLSAIERYLKNDFSKDYNRLFGRGQKGYCRALIIQSLLSGNSLSTNSLVIIIFCIFSASKGNLSKEIVKSFPYNLRRFLYLHRHDRIGPPPGSFMETRCHVPDEENMNRYYKTESMTEFIWYINNEYVTEKHKGRLDSILGRVISLLKNPPRKSNDMTSEIYKRQQSQVVLKIMAEEDFPLTYELRDLDSALRH